MKIKYYSNPSAQDIKFLTQSIHEEIKEFGDLHPFAFFMKNPADEIIAGCDGTVMFGVIYTDQLWVHRDFRKKGIGRELMEKVHNHGRQLGCSMASICTMSFQNTFVFYEKLGYKLEYERNGYAKNSKLIYLQKFL